LAVPGREQARAAGPSLIAGAIVNKSASAFPSDTQIRACPLGPKSSPIQTSVR